MEDGGWKLECAHSSDLRRQPGVDEVLSEADVGGGSCDGDLALR